MIHLKPICKEHAEAFFNYRQQSSTKMHNPIKSLTLNELKASLEQSSNDLSELKENSVYRWIAEDKNEIIGTVSLQNVSLMMNYAEIGYGVLEKYQGQGYGSKIVREFISLVFKETPLRKLIAYVHDQNIPSCKILDNIGFKREGLLRQHFIINGKPENEVLFGLLKSEYKNI